MTNKKIVIVGGVAGGASVAARVRRLDEHAQIIMFEKGPHVSFSNCSLPFHLSGIVENKEDLIMMAPTQFEKQYKIEAKVHHTVLTINREEKTVTVKNEATGKTYEENYDQLVLSPGAKPIVPPVQGVDRSNVFTVRNVVDIDRLNSYIKSNDVKDVAVIGGGFIGIEVAENLRLAGYNVSIVEAGNQVMAPFDYDMAQILHKELIDHNVNLYLEDGLEAIDEGEIQLQSGKKIPAQAVVLAVGVKPETMLAEEACLEIGKTGGIKVNQHYVTSDPNIYAVGDAIEVYNRLTHQPQPTRLALAGPAQRQARAAADHMYGIPHRHTGVIGSSVIKLFELNAASTGLNEKAAQKAGISYDFSYIIPGDKVDLMPDSNYMHFKLIYEYPTGKILGAQAIGKGNVDKRIDIVATLIMMDGTLEDMKDLELGYSPMFGTAKDITNLAALVSLNLLDGAYKQVPVTKVRELVESGAFIVDAREKHEYETSHLKNAVNIPLSEFRQRLDEIPHDVPVYVHCRSGQRSYNACLALQQLGYSNVYNVSGSYLGISFYEYFNDQMTGREKIVTDYNFN